MAAGSLSGLSASSRSQAGTSSAGNGSAAVTEDWRRLYFAAVSWLDFQVGRLLDELTSTGLEEETIVLIHGGTRSRVCAVLSA